MQNVALITPASKTLDPMLVNLPHVFSCPLCVKKILSDSVTVFIVVHEFTVICIRLKKKQTREMPRRNYTTVYFGMSCQQDSVLEVFMTCEGMFL